MVTKGNLRPLSSRTAMNLPLYVTKLGVSCSIQYLLILGAAKDIKAHIKIKFLFEAYDLIIAYNMASNQPPKP